MSSLEAYQKEFARFMISGELSSMEQFMEDSSRSEYMRIYRNGFFRATVEVMKSNFPSVVAMLGEENFSFVVKQYVLEYPPSRGTLVAYGNSFSDFICSSPELSILGEEREAIAALAALDYAWLECYFAEDTSPLHTIALNQQLASGVDIAAMRLKLAGSSRLFTLSLPGLDSWQRLRDGDRTDSSDLEVARQWVLLWRQEQEILYRTLGASEYLFLSNLDSSTIGEAAEKTLQVDGKFDLQTCFAQLLANGLLVDMTQIV